MAGRKAIMDILQTRIRRSIVNHHDLVITGWWIGRQRLETAIKIRARIVVDDDDAQFQKISFAQPSEPT